MKDQKATSIWIQHCNLYEELKSNDHKTSLWTWCCLQKKDQKITKKTRGGGTSYMYSSDHHLFWNHKKTKKGWRRGGTSCVAWPPLIIIVYNETSLLQTHVMPTPTINKDKNIYYYRCWGTKRKMIKKGLQSLLTKEQLKAWKKKLKTKMWKGSRHDNELKFVMGNNLLISYQIVMQNCVSCPNGVWCSFLMLCLALWPMNQANLTFPWHVSRTLQKLYY